jgi:hypothetical protein
MKKAKNMHKIAMNHYVYIILFLIAPTFLYAQDAQSVAERNAAQGFNDTIDRLAPDFVKVSLVVCDPDEILYSTLGHAALHLECPTFNLDYVFSYESESVRDKIWTFLRGNLKMGMFAIPTNDFVDTYCETGRGVKEYTINLSPQQEQKLWEVMDDMVTEGPNLPYDYFRRGCAKSVVQVVHKALGASAIHYAPWPDKYTKCTLREIACNYVDNSPWNEFISYFLIGVEAERKLPCEQKLIVPTDLVEVWQKASFTNGQSVLDATPRVLVDATKCNEETWLTPLLVSIILLFLSLLSLSTLWISNKGLLITGQIVDYTMLTIQSFLGALMVYLVCFSSLPCTSWNWLIIPFNILPAICWRWRKYWALPYAAVCAIWLIVMLCYPHRLIDPAHAVLTVAWIITLLHQKFV